MMHDLEDVYFDPVCEYKTMVLSLELREKVCLLFDKIVCTIIIWL